MVETPVKTKTGAAKGSYVGISSLLVFSVLLVCWIAGFASRLFAVIRFESIIHEFDPW
jgi:dolichyl-diphosphooligosaccharide--protein glycosyltransferase